MNIYITKENERALRDYGGSMSGLVNELLASHFKLAWSGPDSIDIRRLEINKHEPVEYNPSPSDTFGPATVYDPGNNYFRLDGANAITDVNNEAEIPYTRERPDPRFQMPPVKLMDYQRDEPPKEAAEPRVEPLEDVA